MQHNATNPDKCAPMTAPNITPRHTNAAHRHYLYRHQIHKFFIYRVHPSGWSAFFYYSYIYNYISSIPVYQSYSQSRHGGAHKHWFSSQTLFAYTTGPTAANYLPALAFVPTTSPLLYSLVSPPRSHHQSYNYSASQLPHLQYSSSSSILLF